MNIPPLIIDGQPVVKIVPVGDATKSIHVDRIKNTRQTPERLKLKKKKL